MKVIMMMFDSLNRHYLKPYGATQTITPNFERLAEHTVTFDNSYAASLPCMPSRRELHTGRYNFLHRSWGPIEPFDDSMPQILREHGVYSHLVTDHAHYFEDGGCTYHTRYSTWEGFRGQEGDMWKGIVDKTTLPPQEDNLSAASYDPFRRALYDQCNVNQTYFTDEKDHPQTLVFDAGLEFIDRNKDADNWFLQIEAFDPHEPFLAYEKYRALYPSDYDGAPFYWPNYAPVGETPEEVKECRRQYAALLTMCDAHLKRLLDKMDAENLWDDTMLIVNTDHGFLLGEHGFWAKNYMPMYNEVAHTPLFIWDPRNGKRNERSNALVQTIDLPATILDAFGIDAPRDMCGKSIATALETGAGPREYALFGVFGSHVCITDGRYVYMRASKDAENAPLYEYTLMPTHIMSRFDVEECKTMRAVPPLAFTKGMPVMAFDSTQGYHPYEYGDLLFDLETDPQQNTNLIETNPTLAAQMAAALAKTMQEHNCPTEQFERLGLTLSSAQ